MGTKLVKKVIRESLSSPQCRICKEHGFSDHVWNLALMGSNQDKLDAAKYFENGDKPQYENAVILYEKVPGDPDRFTGRSFHVIIYLLF